MSSIDRDVTPVTIGAFKADLKTDFIKPREVPEEYP
jgi:hypothetical protein